MDAIIVIFLTGLISLFVGMSKKPLLVLSINLSGLCLAFTLQLLAGSYESPLKEYAEMLVYNGPQYLFSLLCIAFTALIMLMAYTSQSKDLNHFADINGLMMFSLTGALCLLGFKDFFMFFLGLEILSIPVYVLVGSRKESSLSAEGSLKYFFTGAFATSILLFGIALVFGATGTFKTTQIHFAILSNLYSYPTLILGVFMICSALLFKIGAAPFHFWSPDVYQGSPKPVMAYMSTVVKIAGFVALYKFVHTIFGSLQKEWEYFFYMVIILSLFLGYLSGLKQNSFKRLMAFSGISNTGIALLALLNGSVNGERNLFIFLMGYGAATLVLTHISLKFNDDDNDSISAFEGLGYKNPVLGILALVSLLSLSGIPPFTGFFGKMMLITDIISTHPTMAIAAIISSLIGAYIYLKLIFLLFKKDSQASKISFSGLEWVSISISALAVVGGWCLMFIL